MTTDDDDDEALETASPTVTGAGFELRTLDRALAALDLETAGERTRRAVLIILGYGAFDGAYRKQWALDQALRVLLGDDYEAVVAEWCDGADGPDTYEWSGGQAP